MDTKRLQRFDGARALGDRRSAPRSRATATPGYVYAHCVVDDHSRLAYVELHGADTRRRPPRTLRRAAAWMREQGCRPSEAVMTDNAFVYRHARASTTVLAELGARHILTPPYTPRWNGKVERFIQTLDDEWAHGRIWPNSTTATAPWHPSCATTTAADPTPHSATGHPSAAFTKTEGRTTSAPGPLGGPC